jgi:hypothetical protein
VSSLALVAPWHRRPTRGPTESESSFKFGGSPQGGCRVPCGINVICKSAFAFEKKPSGSVDSSSSSESHLDGLGGRRASLREALKAERKRATASPISSSRSESGNAARGRPPFFESSRYATLPRRYARCPSSLRYLLVAGVTVRRRPTHAPGACVRPGITHQRRRLYR